MILTSDQADTILRSVSIDESLTSSFAQLLLDIGEAFPELKADNENVLHHAKQQLPLALAREERNRVHFAMIQEGIERRKKAMIKILVVGMITLSLPFVILGFLFEAIVSSFRAGQSFYTDLLLAAKR